jgi:hypothetical protein
MSDNEPDERMLVGWLLYELVVNIKVSSSWSFWTMIFFVV